jgi:citrate lyase subunit beta/citryl-CoA lyase
VALANDVFSPPAEEVEHARRILAALEEAARDGAGAAALDGRLIDVASRRMAEGLVAVADAIAERSGGSG